ncbi:sialate O-acetylesterase [Protopterus annectens]|uniref:sialate O-acetylesterase n=1 Tax=Protopterus annectens TaxID=7888 RepID=UPI001CFA81CC|nr:sialate O-acetylesterase [Protopterus annectens]
MAPVFRLLCLTAVFISPSFGTGTFRFASYYNDHMVLQMKPARAVLWGYCEHGANITVNVVKDDKTFYKKETLCKGTGIWKVLLDPEGPGGPFQVTAQQNSTSGQPETAVLKDVLFGDVWICSGQSNMEMTVAQIINASEELAKAASYQHVRIFVAGLAMADKELTDLSKIDLQWSVPTAENLGHGEFTYFSAVCWLFGRYLYDKMQYPVGLIQSCWGGTPIESWISNRVVQRCGVPDNIKSFEIHMDFSKKSPFQFFDMYGPDKTTVLWNAMIHPFLNMTIKGAIWYQGEANTERNTDLYNCTFPAMIKDWRKSFHHGSSGQTSMHFPFGFVQLSTYKKNSTDDSYPRIRWHQTADEGFVPNRKMINTFMAVALDLCDENSPYGSIHPRYKQDVAHRLLLGARAVAYREKGVVYQGPFPTNVGVVQSQLINITYSQELFVNELSQNIFEVCCSSEKGHCDKDSSKWVPAAMISASSNIVSVSASGCSSMYIAGLRYAWRDWPCELKKCPLYNKENILPAPPFRFI